MKYSTCTIYKINDIIDYDNCNECCLLLQFLKENYILLTEEQLRRLQHCKNDYLRRLYWDYISIYPVKFRQTYYINALKNNRDVAEVTTLTACEKFNASILPILLDVYKRNQDLLIRRDIITTIGNIKCSASIEFLLHKYKISRNTMIRCAILFALLNQKRWDFLGDIPPYLLDESYIVRYFAYQSLSQLYRKYGKTLPQYEYDLQTSWNKENSIAVKEQMLSFINVLSEYAPNEIHV